MSDFKKETEKKMELTIEHLKDQLRQIRTGKPQPGLLEPIMVEAYGDRSPLKHLGQITSPELQVLMIAPYDRTLCNAIVGAIEKANLHVRAFADGDRVRVVFPPLDGQTRKEMAKLAKRRGEDAKVAIRLIRRDMNSAIKADKETLGEDGIKREEQGVQKLTDNACSTIDTLVQVKEKEITTI